MSTAHAPERDRLRTEVAQGAAQDLIHAINRLPATPAHWQAARHARKARALVAGHETVRSVPVRIQADTGSQVVHLPIGDWQVAEVWGLRAALAVLGWDVHDEQPTRDPDGCVMTLERIGESR